MAEGAEAAAPPTTARTAYLVSGATVASDINGVYIAHGTAPHTGNTEKTVYVRVRQEEDAAISPSVERGDEGQMAPTDDNGTRWLRYSRNSWMISGTADKEADSEYGVAYSMRVDGVGGDPTAASNWSALVGRRHVDQPDLEITKVAVPALGGDTPPSLAAGEADAAAEEIAAVPLLVMVVGATGNRTDAIAINGVYAKHTDDHNGKPLYLKETLDCDDHNVWLAVGSDSKWHVLSDNAKKHSNNRGFADSVELGAALPTTTLGWTVRQHVQPGITFTSASSHEELTALQRRVAERIAAVPDTVKVCGFEGRAAEIVNGTYIKLSCMVLNGRALFKRSDSAAHKATDEDRWLWADPDGRWCISSTLLKDGNNVAGHVNHGAACDASSVEAGAEVPALDLGWQVHSALPGANSGASTVVPQHGIVVTPVTTLPTAVGSAPLAVTIVGAFGTEAGRINGAYVKQGDTVHHGRAAFKRLGGDEWLHYSELTIEWIVSTHARMVAGSNDGVARAFAQPAGEVLPWRTLAWRICNRDRENLEVDEVRAKSIGTTAELEAALRQAADTARADAERVARSPVAVVISAAPVDRSTRTGRVVYNVNGLYIRQPEPYLGMPLYKSDRDAWLRRGRDRRWLISGEVEKDFGADLDHLCPGDHFRVMRGGMAYSTAVGSDVPRTELEWHVRHDSGQQRLFLSDHAMAITPIPSEAELQRLQEGEEKLRRTVPHAIVLAGAVGAGTADANGTYIHVPDESRSRRPVLRKLGRTGGYWIQFGPNSRWLVSVEKDKDAYTTGAVIHSSAEAGDASLPVASLGWTSLVEGKQVVQESVTLTHMTVEGLAAHGRASVATAATAFPAPWQGRWDSEWNEVVFDNPTTKLTRMCHTQALAVVNTALLVDPATAVAAAAAIGRLEPWHTERQRFATAVLLGTIGDNDDPIARFRDCVVAYSTEAYFRDVPDDAVDATEPEAIAGAVRDFVALGHRGPLAEFKQLLLSNEWSSTQARQNARLFLDVQVELAALHVPLLTAVLDATQRMHLASYDLVMAGIRAEPHFENYAARATEAATTAVELHGPRPLQTTEDVDVLYANAQTIKARFLTFLERVAEKTKARMVVQRDAVAAAVISGPAGSGRLISGRGLHHQRGSERRDNARGDRRTSSRPMASRTDTPRAHVVSPPMQPGHVDQKWVLRLKSAERVLEKSGLRPDGETKWQVGSVCDVVRGALEYNTIDDLANVLEVKPSTHPLSVYLRICARIHLLPPSHTWASRIPTRRSTRHIVNP